MLTQNRKLYFEQKGLERKAAAVLFFLFFLYCSYCLPLCKKTKMKIQRCCKINCLQREARACGQWTLARYILVMLLVLAILINSSSAVVCHCLGPWRDRVSPAGARMLLSFSSIMATPGTTHCSTAERSVIEYGVNLFAVLAKQIIDTHTFVVGQSHWSLRLLLLARLIQTVPNFQWCRTLLSSSSGVNQLTSCSSVFSYN